MKTIAFNVLALLTVFSIACNKKNDTAPPNTNEFNATVLLTTGATVTINAKGSNAKMGCAILGGGNYVNGINSDNASVYLSYIYDGSGSASCVSSPGTYNLVCEFRKNVAVTNTPIWRSSGMNRGSITFIVINDHYMEGHFNAVSTCFSGGCVYGVDSVVITGTFKGNY